VTEETSKFLPPSHTESDFEKYVDVHSLMREAFSPQIIVGYFLGILRTHFGDPQSIFRPLLKDLIWMEGDESKILIETVTNEKLKTVGKRPAILVAREDVNLKRETLDYSVHQLGPELGQNYYATAHGAVTIFCITNDPNYTELLAAEVFQYLLYITPEIEHSLCCNRRFDVKTLGRPAEVEGYGGTFVIPVVCNYVSDIGWELRENIPRLRSMVASMIWNIKK